MASKRHIHLVGSINLPNAEEAMTTASDIMGKGLLRLPDGEPGPRRGWIFYQRPMFTHNRYLDAPDHNETGAADHAHLPRVLRPGVRPEDIEFPELGYAREARLSYAWFCKARAEGRIPGHLRFQVSLPTPFAVLTPAVAPECIADVEPAYEAAMLREVAQIAAEIPHHDLAMQWDICLEMCLFDGQWNIATPFDEACHRARLRRLTCAVPADVHLGAHLCYGDYDGKHIIQPRDATRMTAFANMVTQEAGRPLQWIHMPVPIDRKDDAFFSPLAGLKLHSETELYLGLVHLRDGVDGTQARIHAAEKYVHNFGVATECGIGRMHSRSDIRELFRIHSVAIEGS